jgi:predicted permease
MFDILAITAPIYVAIFLGYGLTRWGVFQKSDMRGFGTFVIKVSLPAMLFNALSNTRVKEIFKPSYLAAYALASLATLALALVWSMKIKRESFSFSSCYAMGMSCPNSGFVGYPVVLLSLGPIAGVVLALNMIVELFFIIPILMAWADAQEGKNSAVQVLWQTFNGMLKNTLLWCIVLGFLFSWFDIGGSLVGLSVQGMGPRVSQIAFGKLILHPLTMLFVLLWLVPISDPLLRAAAILSCAMPMFGIYPILTQKHGHEGLSAAALLVTTVASFFSLNGVLWLLKTHPI